LKCYTYFLVLVLAPNYKEHILSPAEVKKVYYLLTEIYVRFVYLNLFGRKGCVKFMKHFKGGGGANYRSLKTSAVVYFVIYGVQMTKEWSSKTEIARCRTAGHKYGGLVLQVGGLALD
jgi:hypothetical protein